MKYRVFKTLIFIFIIVSATSAISANNIKENYYRTKSKDLQLPYSERIKYIDSLIMCVPNDYNLKLEKAELADKNGSYSVALGIYTDVFKKNNNILTAKEKGDILKKMLSLYYIRGDYMNCINIAKEYFNLAVTSKEKKYNISAYLCLADVSRAIWEKETCLKFIRLSENLYNDISLSKSDAEFYEFSILFQNLLYDMDFGNFEDALVLAKKAQTFVENHPAITCEELTTNMALIYQSLKEYNIAATYYEQIFEDTNNRNYNMGINIINYMDLLNNMGQYEKSLSIEKDNNKYVDALGKGLNYTYLLRNRADALIGLGHQSEANDVLKEAFLLTDSINSSSSKIGNELINMELDKILNEKVNAENDSRHRGWLILLLCVGLIIAGWLGIIFWRKTQKHEVAATLMKADIAELERTREAEVAANKVDMEEKSRALTSRSLQLAQISDYVYQIGELTADKSLSDKEKVAQISRKIKSLNFQNDVWDTFKVYFEDIHTDFFKRLAELHPDLTTNEIRICAYIVMHFNTKEIASLTSRSYRTIHTMKYRIHKKMNLPAGSSLDIYLHKLSTNSDENDEYSEIVDESISD